jgi:pilus assembly protein CpaF
VASALDLVVHQARLPDGSRVIESVTEVVRVAGGVGTRELYARGGEARRPEEGPLAARLEAFAAAGARPAGRREAGSRGAGAQPGDAPLAEHREAGPPAAGAQPGEAPLAPDDLR